jgi:hypothetical protein
MSDKAKAPLRLAEQEELIIRLHRDLSCKYPGLKMRWSRIYGSRWAHFLGGSAEVSFFPVKLVLNQDFGLWIENPEVLAQADLERIVGQLKGEFGL